MMISNQKITPFSLKFGWIEDKFGVSWQLSLEKISRLKNVQNTVNCILDVFR